MSVRQIGPKTSFNAHPVAIQLVLAVLDKDWLRHNEVLARYVCPGAWPIVD
jgi:hypothetical protein